MDNVNNRLFIPGQGNGNLSVFQLDDDGLLLRRTADYVLGHKSIYGRRTSSGDVNVDTLPFGGTPTIDEVNQRLFIVDRTVTAWGPGQRILVFDIHPDRIETGSDAIAVIGAPDFESREIGLAANRFQSASVTVDGSGERLFVTDGPNNRVMVFDVHPDRLQNDPDAVAVIGQTDLVSNTPGLSASKLSRPGAVVIDRVNQRMFVPDNGNNRILIFDIHPDRFTSNPEAIAVLGQADFVSNNPKESDNQIGPGSMSYDEATGRLLISDSGNNRILVYDVSPENLTNYPEPLGLIGQPDYETVTADLLTFDPEYARSKTLGPRIADGSISARNQLLYVSEGYWAGNRVGIFDISGKGNSLTGGNMVDVVGHIDDNGEPSFTARAANDRVDDRNHYPRSVALDPVDHRLFTIDQYNHRVMVWQLGPNNELLDRKAIAVIGQPNFNSAVIYPPSSRIFRIPGAVAYDPAQKLLFVGDGWYNRVMVFDADPERLENFPEAIAVIGQPDFTTVNSEMTQISTNFDVAVGRHGITSGNPRAMGIAVDSEGQRLFVSDGPNYRVMVFDISPGNLANGIPAMAVIGKPDFTSGRTILNGRGRSLQGPATRNTFSSMSGDLVFDSNHGRLFVIDGRSHRVLVFDVTPQNLTNGMDALAVIGQGDFESVETIRLDTEVVSESIGRSRLRWPDGIAYDTRGDRLILSDKGNDRILVFEASPEILENGMEASFVIGQKDFVSREPGQGRQDQLMDARGIAFDSEHQRLYVTDSFWARLMVFDFARSDREISLAANATLIYATIDASIDEPYPQQSGYAVIDTPLASAAVYSVTQNSLQEESMRESRTVVSEAAVPSVSPSVTAHLFVRKDDAHETRFLLGNPATRSVQLTFTFRDISGRSIESTEITLSPGEQRRISTSELAGGENIQGLVTVESSAPVFVTALSETQNSRSELILSRAARINDANSIKDATLIVPQVLNGAGYQTRIILMNPSDEELKGRIDFYTPNGDVAGLPLVSYEIPPRGFFEYLSDGDSVIARNGYASVIPESSSAPAVAAWTELWDGEILISESRVDTSASRQRIWIPINTLQTPTRHGEIEASLTVVNDNPTGASLRFILYSMDGTEIDRYEKIIREQSQVKLSLVQLFNIGQFKGTLRIFSDTPVSFHAGQVTVNLRGEPIAMQLPVFGPDSSSSDRMLNVIDGGGLMTEILMVNTGETELNGELLLLTSDGEPMSLPLR